MSQDDLTALVESLLDEPRPVAFLDTSVYLDFFNNALEKVSQDNFLKVEAMVKRREINLLVPEIILEEFRRNQEVVRKRLENRIREVIEQSLGLRRLHSNFGDFDQDEREPLPRFLESAPSTHLAQVLSDRIEGLLSAGITFTLSEIVIGRAYKRMRDAIKPARRGKDSLGDCEITETLIEVAGNLRGRDFTAPIIFVSSNTSDFADIDKSLHPQIASDFTPLKIDYYHQVGRAAAELLSYLHEPS